MPETNNGPVPELMTDEEIESYLRRRAELEAAAGNVASDIAALQATVNAKMNQVKDLDSQLLPRLEATIRYRFESGAGKTYKFGFGTCKLAERAERFELEDTEAAITYCLAKGKDDLVEQKVRKADYLKLFGTPHSYLTLSGGKLPPGVSIKPADTTFSFKSFLNGEAANGTQA